MRRFSISLSIAALLLATAILAVLRMNSGACLATEWQPLADRFPLQINGWIGEDLPLGTTETVLTAVRRLNYTDYIYRRYRKGRGEVWVYAMFWRQGQISVREMAGHTPDGCWVSNGAQACAPVQREPLLLKNGLTEVGEVRAFIFPHSISPLHVIWWHFWGDDLVPSNFKEKSIVVPVHELWVWLISHRGKPAEQLFIRVHSTEPVPVLAENIVVQSFIGLFPQVAKPATHFR